MTSTGAVIHRVGLVTAVGMGAPQTAASILAGISGYRESAVMNNHFEPLVMALLPEEALPPLEDSLVNLPGLTSRQRRLLRLATPAISEVLADLPIAAEAVPLFLSVPEKHPELPAPVADSFLDHLATQSDANFDRVNSRLFSTGRAGGFEALQVALERLVRGEIEYALVGGVDSHLDLRLLATLEEERRILTGDVMDGFIPGEAAGFLLLGRSGAQAAPGLETLARVPGAQVAQEPGYRYSKEPYKGEGLAAAVASLLDAPHALREPVRSAYLGLNGESFPAKEWGVTSIRSSAQLSPELDVRHPADCFGDIGAASGPVAIGLAALGIHAGSCAAPCVVWSSSEGPQRGAALVDIAG